MDRAIVGQLVSVFERSLSGSHAVASRGDGLSSKAAPIRPYSYRIVLCGVLVAGLGSFVSPWLGFGALGSAALGVWLLTIRSEKVRREAIDRDMAALVTSVASSVRAGIDPLQALCDAQEYFPPTSPLSHELQALQRRLAAGEDEIIIINSFCAQDEHPDVELFKRCVVLSRAHGGSLSEPLHRVTRVVRQRQSFRRKTRAALAMHRMSALGIALCAICIGAMQFAMNLSGVRIAVANPIGLSLLSIGGVLICAGVAWMLMMGKEEKL